MAHELKDDLYVDIDGARVDATDPRVQTFVGTKGASITDEEARRYGLIKGKADIELAEHDEGSDPANAANPVVGGVPAPDGDARRSAKK